MAQRYPTVGGDSNVWGGILNGLLQVAISSGGYLLGTLPVFNIQDESYASGAKGDGTTNDTTAITSCYAAAASAGGGIVFWPLGSYLLSSGIIFNADNIWTLGAGFGTIAKPVGNFDVFSTPIPTTEGAAGYTRYYTKISDMQIDCSGMTGSTAGKGNAIHLYGSRYGRIENVFIKSAKNWAILSDGDNTSPGSNFGYDNVVENCIFDLCNGNMCTVGSEANDILHCRFKWCGGTLAAAQPAFGAQDTVGMHIRCEGGYMLIDGNILGTGGGYTTECLRVSNSGPCRIINNRFDQPNYQAMVLNGGNHMVSHNQLGSPSSVGSTFGIQIGSSRNIITSNKFDTTAGAAHYTYCIGEAGGPFTGNVICTNGLVAGTSGTIYQNGSSTNVVANNGT